MRLDSLSRHLIYFSIAFVAAACSDDITIYVVDGGCQLDAPSASGGNLDAAVGADAAIMETERPPLSDAAPDVASDASCAADALCACGNDGGPGCDVGTVKPRLCVAADFDGDGKTDFGVWNPKTGAWRMAGDLPFLEERADAWADTRHIAVPGDFNGDGFADFGSYDPDGFWLTAPYTHGTPLWVTQWGTAGDIPLTLDFDQDGICDMTTWRPSAGLWHVLPSSAPGTRQIWELGTAEDQPVPGDYDGDGRGDIAFYRAREGQWRVSLLPSARKLQVDIGGELEDVAVPGDYDGDGRPDYVVFRPSTATWFMRFGVRPTDAVASLTFGDVAAVPVEGDFDGDGKADLATWLAATGIFKARSSRDGSIITHKVGGADDMPLTAPAFLKGRPRP